MSRLSRLPRVMIFLAVLAIAFALVACQKPAVTFDDLLDLPAVNLEDGDMKYILAAARTLLDGREFTPDSAGHAEIFAPRTAAAFALLERGDRYALEAFGTGDTIYAAVAQAVDRVRFLAGTENPGDFRLRLDLITGTTSRKTHDVAKRWDNADRETRGYIFASTPPIAVLPDEVIMRNVIDYKGRYYFHRLRDIVRDRQLGKQTLNTLPQSGEVAYARFDRVTVMEDPRREPIPLLNGRPLVNSLDPPALLEACAAGGRYLEHIIDDKGQFQYIYYPHMERSSDKYNLLRHAGTAYAMTELYEVTGDPSLLKKIVRTHDYLIELVEGPTPEDELAGVRFKALVDPKTRVAKAGGSALMIVALAKYTTVTGDQKYLPLMRELARFILHQTEPNGHLLCKYYKRPHNDPPFDSIYYPGECVLALTRLYELDPDPAWLAGADKLVGYMVHIRDAALPIASLPHDHWLLIALNELLPLIDYNKDYTNHAFKIAQSIYDLMRKTDKRPDWVGSFYTPPRSTPPATRNEGIIATYRLAKKLGRETDIWLRTSRTIASLQRRMQFTDVTGMLLPSPGSARGGFARGYENPEIRIDYVQHNISSLLGLWKILMEEQGADLDTLMKGRAKPAAEVKPAA